MIRHVAMNLLKREKTKDQLQEEANPGGYERYLPRELVDGTIVSYAVALTPELVSMSEPVLSIDDGGVCVITLNRPARLNAINPALLDGLNTTLARADADERIGAIVLTGAGRAFCAGDDLVEQRSMLDADEATLAGFVDAIQQVTRHIMFGDTPVVAAVRGWAVGGAFSWPVNCDFSVWSDDARGFFPELRIGLYPERRGDLSAAVAGGARAGA